MLPAMTSLLVLSCAENKSFRDVSAPYYSEVSYESAIAEDVFIPSEDNRDKFEEFEDNAFVKVASKPTSTFSVDADGASYAIMRRYVESDRRVPVSSVRIEEFLNYFTFDYPSPTDGNTVALNAEVGDCPWNQEHLLLRLGIKGKELSQEEIPQANFVFLVDVSGSMYSSDKLDLLKSGLIELVDKLNPNDRISLITYSGSVKKLLESTPVRESETIKKAIKKLKAAGSTAGGEALKMAYEEALANYNPKYNNRVIMGTDGDFNVGVSNTEELVEMVEKYAKEGIYMTCLGFGSGNLNDEMMEKISNSGNGTYQYIDSEDEMMKVFVHERERFVSVANDSKCQVTFAKDFVESYRLVGYENRVMNDEDFKDDKKDAGEIGAGQTITALYEIVPTAKFRQLLKARGGKKDIIATFDFRYKKTLDSPSKPLKLTITAEDLDNKEMSENLSLAAGVTVYGMLLRNSPHKGEGTMKMAKELVKNSLKFDPHGYRAELLKLMNKVDLEEDDDID